ncbi:rCG26531 [Rattus norvegicus]|uniref:RCG26531 n=1 Tax=Rattus norvegicus TaxID=10116 RepID=A6HMB7_RAT|nr:rCG26531 [Rattus norvegicus]
MNLPGSAVSNNPASSPTISSKPPSFPHCPIQV